MKRNVFLILISLAAALGFSACADDVEKKPVGPVSDTTNIPWNTPVAGQGGGQMGMMPQNQYRR
ncbi:MAG: hypothetical protein ABIS50_20930 [Luteolibacter sp.]|uniref:hypothetical protein n=1 Tax=Luteolibacter sp. TaxID=1962973 RepID=UPI003266C300